MKRKLSEKVFNIFNILIISILCIIMVYPFLNQLAIALNDSLDTSVGGITIFPRVPTLQNFKTVLANETVLYGFVVSVLRVVIGTLLSLLVTFSAGYALAAKSLKGRKAINVFLSVPMYLSAGMIPIYILYRYLGLINNFWVYVLPGVFSFYNMMIIRSYIEGLPDSLEEAAMVDGANEFIIMKNIIVPVSLPVIATVVLWVAVGYWNDWNTTLLYITNSRLYTLQYVMMQIIKQSETVQNMMASSNNALLDQDAVQVTTESVQAAVLMVATVPILVVYPFLQKYFIGGITLGAVKG